MNLPFKLTLNLAEVGPEQTHAPQAALLAICGLTVGGARTSNKTFCIMLIYLVIGDTLTPSHHQQSEYRSHGRAVGVHRNHPYEQRDSFNHLHMIARF